MVDRRRRRPSPEKRTRNLRICWLRDEQGLSIEAIAGAEGLTVRSVLRILAATRPLVKRAEERRHRRDQGRLETAAAG
jgi:hypothetical protein